MDLMTINREWSAIKFQVPWKFRDVLIVFLISFFFIIFSIPLSGLFFEISGLFLGDALGQRIFLQYICGFVLLFVPIIWVKKLYKAKLDMLGIRKGRWPISYIILVGIGLGVGCYFATSAIFGLRLKINEFLIQNFYSIILSKFTFWGFFMFVLTPVGEEISDRGFLYGYLRSRVGVLFGLLIQSLIFSLFHLELEATISGQIPLIIHKFCLGLLFGTLYEMSGSLYPSLICHGILNFLNV
jgi:hypothetical protein